MPEAICEKPSLPSVYGAVLPVKRGVPREEYQSAKAAVGRGSQYGHCTVNVDRLNDRFTQGWIDNRTTGGGTPAGFNHLTRFRGLLTLESAVHHPTP